MYVNAWLFKATSYKGGEVMLRRHILVFINSMTIEAFFLHLHIRVMGRRGKIVDVLAMQSAIYISMLILNWNIEELIGKELSVTMSTLTWSRLVVFKKQSFRDPSQETFHSYGG